MPLAARLLVAFGVVAIIATALVGFTLREASREIIESGFADRIDAAHAGVGQQLAWEAEAWRVRMKLLATRRLERRRLVFQRPAG